MIKEKLFQGFTFILVVLELNLFPLTDIMIKESNIQTISIFFTILTLLSGSAIGFFNTEIWWGRFRGGKGQYPNLYGRKLAEYFVTLIRKYKLIRNPKTENEKERVLSVFGYVIHHEMAKPEKKEILSYTTRRWDLYHAFASVKWSLITALFLGWPLRFLFSQKLIGGYQELIITVSISFIAVFFIFRMEKAKSWLNTQYEPVTNSIIRDSNIENLQKIFPPDFFDTSIINDIDEAKSEILRKNGIKNVRNLAYLDNTAISQIENSDNASKILEIKKLKEKAQQFIKNNYSDSLIIKNVKPKEKIIKLLY